MLTPPELLWRTEPGSLYTILLVNTDIEDSLQVHNSPGQYWYRGFSPGQYWYRGFSPGQYYSPGQYWYRGFSPGQY